MRQMLFAVAVLAAVLQIPSVATPQVSPGHCARAQALASVKQIVRRFAARVEPVHIPRGLAVEITSPTQSGTRALYAAAKQYISSRARAMNAGGDPCSRVWHEVAAGETTEQITPTTKGLLVLYTAKRPSTVRYLQDSGCCDWCVCPAGTVTSCVKCCGAKAHAQPEPLPSERQPLPPIPTINLPTRTPPTLMPGPVRTSAPGSS